MSKFSDFFPSGFDPQTASTDTISQILKKLRVAAEKQDMEATVVLGYWYEIGLGVDANEEIAVALYETATQLGSQLAPYNLAMIHLRSGRIKQAIQNLEASIARGSAQATATLGSLYEDGVYVDRDLEKAIGLYQSGVKEKNVHSVLRFVSCYRRGLTNQIEYVEAKAMLESILTDDAPQGWYELGMLISSELNDSAHSITEAMMFFKKAADLGQRDALAWCGEVYSMGLDGSRKMQKGVHYLEDAIQKGSTRAKYVMAVLYANDKGTLADSTKAFKLCLDSAAEGEVDAMNMLGLMFLRGHGVAKDRRSGEMWIRKAASMGHSYALKKVCEGKKGSGADKTT